MAATMSGGANRGLQRLQVPSPVESLITVDALHVQCPLCLYVFFMDERKGQEIWMRLASRRRDGVALRLTGFG